VAHHSPGTLSTGQQLYCNNHHTHDQQPRLLAVVLPMLMVPLLLCLIGLLLLQRQQLLQS